ncbi:MAG: type II secretion system protein [Candidatus Pacebacteria bacterium]|nr:type II secretion system protein [Candidatus Paceibacterota bacterium]
MFLIKNKNLKNGFTLIEALVAISLLMIAISGPMTIVQKGLNAAYLSRDQMTAAFLVQDAIEAVRNIRDTLALNGIEETDNNWLGGLSSCFCELVDNNCDFDNPGYKFCNIDTTKENLSVAVSDNLDDKILEIETNDDGEFVKYDLDSVKKSKFTRIINIHQPADDENEAVVRVRVSWMAQGGEQNVDVSNYIYRYTI